MIPDSYARGSDALSGYALLTGNVDIEKNKCDKDSQQRLFDRHMPNGCIDSVIPANFQAHSFPCRTASTSRSHIGCPTVDATFGSELESSPFYHIRAAIGELSPSARQIFFTGIALSAKNDPTLVLIQICPIPNEHVLSMAGLFGRICFPNDIELISHIVLVLGLTNGADYGQ
jgi:hypothetical protein